MAEAVDRPAAGLNAGPAIRVFVQLAHGTDAATWLARLADGRVLGVNERTPYGYGLASQWGCDVRFSADAREGGGVRFARRALRRVLGFDLVHVWRNRRALLAADVVWTHTEDQTLAVLLLLRLHAGRARRPRVVGQSIWLFDRWAGLGPLRCAGYLALLRTADVLTVHSPLNLAALRALLPQARAELVRFGISTQAPFERAARLPSTPLRLLAVGGDRDRDWATLVAALGDDPRYALTLVSSTVPAALVAGRRNVRVVHPADNRALFALYADADLGVVALQPNLHASGATVVQECALMRLPVICTRAGGLDAYFDDTQLRFVAPADPAALRAAIDALAADPAAAAAQAGRAHRQLVERLGAAAFVHRHVELSRELLADAVPATPGRRGPRANYKF